MRHRYENVRNLVIQSTGGGGYLISFEQDDLAEGAYPPAGTEYYENVHGDLLAFHSNEEDSGPISMWSHNDDAWIGWDSVGSSRTRDDIRRYATPIQAMYVDIPLDR